MISSLFAAGLLVAVIGSMFAVDRWNAAKIAASYKKLQELMLRELTFMAPEPRHAAAFGALGEVPAGIRVLGDVIELIGSEEAPVRIGIDDTATSLVLLAKNTLSFYSFGEEVLITDASPRRYPLASPSFVHHLHLARTSPAEALRAHRERIAGMDGLRPIASLDDAQRELIRLHSLDIAWRERQHIEDLIEADLRALLGARYEVLGHAVGRRVLPAVPQAKVVR